MATIEMELDEKKTTSDYVCSEQDALRIARHAVSEARIPAQKQQYVTNILVVLLTSPANLMIQRCMEAVELRLGCAANGPHHDGPQGDSRAQYGLGLVDDEVARNEPPPRFCAYHFALDAARSYGGVGGSRLNWHLTPNPKHIYY